MLNTSDISTLPPEILEDIISEIGKTKDLLSLALADRALYNLVVPHHIEYRSICCSPFHEELWEAFASHPVLAARVRHLRVVPPSSHPSYLKELRIPSSIPCVLKPEKQSVARDSEISINDRTPSLLITAVSNMSRLKTFSWLRYHKSMDNLQERMSTLIGDKKNGFPKLSSKLVAVEIDSTILPTALKVRGVLRHKIES